MGWSFRKSFGSGPFRVNFSKRGVSYSVGVRGARVNVGPRGTYVNLSSHGITYRRKISSPAYSVPSPTPAPQHLPATFEPANNIASAEIQQLTDTDSKDFVSELTQKSGLIAYVKWFGVFPLIVFILLMLFTSFDSHTIVVQPATDSTLVAVTSDQGVNIRKLPDPKSAVVKVGAHEQAFQLLDSSNRKWLKVGFHDSVGYINRRFAAITPVHHDQVTDTQTNLANPLALYELSAGIIAFIFLIRWLKKLDKKRFEVNLHYDMDEHFQQVYDQFGTHFSAFAGSARIWQYLNASQTDDYKRTGGAGKLIKRTAVRGIFNNQSPLPHFNTNVNIPCLKLSNLEFYFLPERLLVKRGAIFGAVFYKNLRISGATTRFIEEEGVPGDAQVVGQTWRYLNKNGGPDRRFNDNRQIPVCNYSEYALTSDTGIYEVLTTSKLGAMDGFAGFLRQIGELQSRMVVS